MNCDEEVELVHNDLCDIISETSLDKCVTTAVKIQNSPSDYEFVGVGKIKNKYVRITILVSDNEPDQGESK